MIEEIKNIGTEERKQKRLAELRKQLQETVVVRTDLTEEEKQARFEDLRRRVQATNAEATGIIAEAVKTKKKGEKLVKKLNRQNEKALKKIKKSQQKCLDTIVGSGNLV